MATPTVVVPTESKMEEQEKDEVPKTPEEIRDSTGRIIMDQTYDPQLYECALCSQRLEPIIIVRGYLQRVVFVTGLVADGRQLDEQLKQFLLKPMPEFVNRESEDTGSINICVETLHKKALQLQELVNNSPIGVRIFQELAEQVTEKCIAENVLMAAVFSFINDYFEVNNELLTRARSTFYRFIPTFDDDRRATVYENLVELEHKKPQCLVCERIVTHLYSITDKKFCLKFSIIVCYSHLAMGVMKRDQAIIAYRLKTFSICLDHNGVIAKRLRKYLEEDLHGIGKLEELEEFARNVAGLDELGKSLLALSNFVYTYDPPFEKGLNTCFDCGRCDSDVLHDTCLQTYGHYTCFRKKAIALLVKMSVSCTANLEKLPWKDQSVGWRIMKTMFPSLENGNGEATITETAAKCKLHLMLARYIRGMKPIRHTATVKKEIVDVGYEKNIERSQKPPAQQTRNDTHRHHQRPTTSQQQSSSLAFDPRKVKKEHYDTSYIRAANREASMKCVLPPPPPPPSLPPTRTSKPSTFLLPPPPPPPVLPPLDDDPVVLIPPPPPPPLSPPPVFANPLQATRTPVKQEIHDESYSRAASYQNTSHPSTPLISPQRITERPNPLFEILSQQGIHPPRSQPRPQLSGPPKPPHLPGPLQNHQLLAPPRPPQLPGASMTQQLPLPPKPPQLPGLLTTHQFYAPPKPPQLPVSSKHTQQIGPAKKLDHGGLARPEQHAGPAKSNQLAGESGNHQKAGQPRTVQHTGSLGSQYSVGQSKQSQQVGHLQRPQQAMPSKSNASGTFLHTSHGNVPMKEMKKEVHDEGYSSRQSQILRSSSSSSSESDSQLQKRQMNQTVVQSEKPLSFEEFMQRKFVAGTPSVSSSASSSSKAPTARKRPSTDANEVTGSMRNMTTEDVQDILRNARVPTTPIKK